LGRACREGGGRRPGDADAPDCQLQEGGEHYRRDDEVHRVRLYDPSELSAELRRVGFEVWTMHGYGRYPLAEGHAAFVARKPA